MLEAIRVNRACAFCEKREWQAELVDRALHEMVFRGGRLNVRLLGGDMTAAQE